MDLQSKITYKEDNMSHKRTMTSVIKQDRETTRDGEVSQLSHIRSARALPVMRAVHSPSGSCVSAKTSLFRRGPPNEPSFDELASEIQRFCSGNARQLLDRLIKRSQECAKQNIRLKAQLARVTQEMDAAKLKEVAAEAKLYDANKRLQSCEAQLIKMRDKRQAYIVRLSELQHKQIELNKLQITCMVRQKASKASASCLGDWTKTILTYRSELHKLRTLIEQVITNPGCSTYRKLADTIVRSLESQQVQLEKQAEIVGRLDKRLEGTLQAVRRGA